MSTAPAKQQKTRRSTPRARTGCQTCRKRRVKCDETRPSCVKCLRAGWPCDGYDANADSEPPPSSHGAVTRVPRRSALSIANYAIPFKVPGSQRDRQMLHYFFVQGSQDIAGFLGSDFWSRIVPQESHHDHVVRQALVSVSSLHLDYVTAEAPPRELAGTEALVRYDKALRALRKRLEDPSRAARRAALICCILFYCFESTLGNAEAAMRHLNSGLSMLPAYRRGQVGQDDEALAKLSGIFERLDMQATFFDDDRVPLLTLAPAELQDTVTGDLPFGERFSCLDDAQRALVELQNWLFHFLTKNMYLKGQSEDTVPLEVQQEDGLLTAAFDRWMERFEELRSRKSKDDEDICGVYTLVIHWRVSRMLLESDLPTGGGAFRTSPNPPAEEILELAERILERTGERKASAEAAKNPRRNLSSETGVVAPLFLLAMKCTDESVSARAARLLADSERREGLYDSQAMSAVIEQLRAAREENRVQPRRGNGAATALEDWLPEGVEQDSGGMDKLTCWP